MPDPDNIIRFRRRDQGGGPSQGSGSDPGPLFNLPPVVQWVTLAMLGVQLLTLIPGLGRLPVWMSFALPRLTDPVGDPIGLLTPALHIFAHAGWLHLAFNLLMLLVFGTQVAAVLSVRRWLILFFTAGILGGFAVPLLSPDPDQAAVFGGSGAILGLMGAWILLVIGRRSPEQLTGAVGVVLLLILVPVVIGGPMNAVAWQAHLVGFITGLVMAHTWRAGPGLGTRRRF